MKRKILTTAVLCGVVALSGCGIFKGGGGHKPKTPVLGERIPVLSSETDVEVDPTLAGVMVALPAVAANADWPQPGGNPQHAMDHVALGSALSHAWSVNIDGGGKRARLGAAPVVANGAVYVVDTRAVVHAYDVQNGGERWKVSLGDSKEKSEVLFGGGVSFDGGKLYATDGAGDAAALDPTDGKILWKKRPGGPLRGAPTVSNGNVYVVSQDNQIFALNAEKGDTVWTQAATVETAGVFGSASPAVGQGTVVAGFSSGELNAYRYENGRTVWQDALSRTSMSTSVSSLSDIDADPVIDQGRVFAVGQGGRMVAMEMVTGQRQWELNIAGISTPWSAGDWLFVVTDEAKLLCISKLNGKIRWITQLERWKDDKPKKGPVTWVGPVLAGGRLILANSEGQLVNVQPDTGKLGETTKGGGPIYLPLVVASNTLFVLDNSGRLTAWR